MRCFSYRLFLLKKILVLIFVTFFVACEDYPSYIEKENNPPQSMFSITSVNNYEVTFENESLHATSYLWNFGDESSSSDISVVHTYASKGRYTVTLAATDNNGLEDTSTTLVAVGFPLASFSYEAEKLNVSFTNESVNAVSYLWNFGDGTTSTEKSPLHVFPEEGSYTVSLSAVDGGDENAVSMDIYVVGKYQPIILSPSFEGETSVYRLDWDWNGASGTSGPTPPDGINGAKFGSNDWIAQTFEVEENTNYLLSYWFVTKGGEIGLKITVMDGEDSSIIRYEGQTGATESASVYLQSSFEFNSGGSKSVTLRFDYGDVESRLDMITIK